MPTNDECSWCFIQELAGTDVNDDRQHDIRIHAPGNEPFLVYVSVTNAKSSKCWWDPSLKEEFCETVTILPLDPTLKAELSFDKNLKSLYLLLIF